MRAKVLITGVSGQDGKLLSEFLLEKDYEIYGLVRRVAERKFTKEGVNVIEGDIRDTSLIESIVAKYKFDEIYHLASISDVAYSFEHPAEVYDVNINGTLNLLNAIRKTSIDSFYFAGTSEMFGKPTTKPQTEDYPMKPVSPYGVSKLAGYWSSNLYRQAYNLPIYCGILYNHESKYRPENFVTTKIIKGVKRYIKTGVKFSLGNIMALKDWGYAPEYVRGMYEMVHNAPAPSDYILATNEQHSVKEFLDEVVKLAGIDRMYVDESLYDVTTNFPVVTFEKSLYRPNEADNYMGEYYKAFKDFGWKPTIRFKELVRKLYEEIEV